MSKSVTLGNTKLGNLTVARTVLAIAAVVSMGAAQAGTDTRDINVKINIIPSCDIHTTLPTDVNFGDHTPFETNVTTNGALTVKCSTGTTYAVALNDGANFATGSRRMKSGTTNFIPYGLFKDATFLNAWGSTGPLSVAGTGNGANQVLTVYGRVPSTAGAIGAYLDVVTATVTY